MRVRALDTSHRWLFGKGRSDYKTAKDAIKQNIQTRLLSFFGDCFFDLTAGIDYFSYIGTNNQVRLVLSLSATLLNTENVVRIDSINVTRNSSTRGILVEYSVTTIYGIIESTIPVFTADFLRTESGDFLVTESGDPLVV